MYPGAELDPPGGDCSGVVVSSSSSSLAPGTPVFGLASGCLGTLVHCAASTLVPMPAQLSFEQAATMPTVFMTAHTAFGSASRVKAGERVMVHAAAGGVGLASVQVLREMGAVVVATAGGPTKRALLRSLGVAHVGGSRDTVFVEELAVGGSGVDVILNTLTSPGLVSSALALLSHGGRMVEISKRDIWHASRAAQERPDLSFGMVAIDFLPGAEVQKAMSRVASGAASGALSPLPVACHGICNVSAALRQMSQARHVGKVVVTIPPPDLCGGGQQSSDLPSGGFITGGLTVAITGGLGALGILTAGWLASQGVGRILLLGRSGRTATAEAAVGKQAGDVGGGRFRSGLPPSKPLLLGSSGVGHAVSVTSIACDIGLAEDLTGVDGISSWPMHQTGGTGRVAVHAWFHAGGLLVDASLRNHTLAGLRAVAAPKMASAAAGSRPSSLLQPSGKHVLFSSVASLLGSAGRGFRIRHWNQTADVAIQFHLGHSFNIRITICVSFDFIHQLLSFRSSGV